MWWIFHTKSLNVTSIIAPYRVRVTEMVIEVTFGLTVECLKFLSVSLSFTTGRFLFLLM